MSRKRNHRMRPEVRQHMQRGTIAALFPEQMAQANQLHSDEVVASKMILLRTSLVCFMEGTADDKDMARIGGEVNTCWIAAGKIEGGALVQERLQEVGPALEVARLIKEKHGRYGLTGRGRLALQAGVETIELVLRATSPKQMHDAEQELNRLLRQQQRKAA